MDPDELEFIGENESIGIIPNFTLDDAIHLISGSIGPFRAGMPVHGKRIFRSFFTVVNQTSLRNSLLEVYHYILRTFLAMTWNSATLACDTFA